ncbi:hypothetical protein IQ250_29125 [Pseudanabaenaceae cyanobacterium LEGE 13415]|nr:hypothetical protein [Pseudanabaenaceae cyanobacterium LEGE 13415]
MQDQPSRLDRIEVNLERMQQQLDQMQQQQDRIQQQQDRFQQQQDRIQQQYDNERQLIAELRTRQEVESQKTASLRDAAEALLRTTELHQRNIEILADAIRRHRSDGHGA